MKLGGYRSLQPGSGQACVVKLGVQERANGDLSHSKQGWRVALFLVCQALSWHSDCKAWWAQGAAGSRRAQAEDASQP